MKLTFTQLRYVVAVARHGSITAAGRALNVSQPSISTAVDQVEKLYGQKLFVRQRGSAIALTPFGHTAVAKARQVLAEAEELAALGTGSSAVAGEVVLGCFEDLAPYSLPPSFALSPSAIPASRSRYRRRHSTHWESA